MRRPEDDEPTRVPFPTVPVSNGEWFPLAVTAKQRLAGRRIAEAMDAGAKRHGMTRGQFLRTAAATTTAFWVMNEVYGLPQSGEASAMPLSKASCQDLDAGRELLDKKKWFIMDVQQHHVDLKTFGPASSTFCFLRFLVDQQVCQADPDQLGQLNYVKEIYIDSETDIGVISGLPGGVPMGPKAMADTGNLVNQLAGSQRAVWQAVCDPKNNPGTPTSIDAMEEQVKVRKGRALKCYTYNGNWRLDDEQVAYPMLQEASRLGLRLVNVHKGLPAIFAPGSPESVRTTDFPKVVRDFPHLKFCAYHSGYFQGDTHPTGKAGITEFLEMIAQIPRKLRRNVYAEIGSTFAFTFLQGPDQAAHLVGALLKAVGSRNVLWGTDSIWWGSPQWLIDAFKALTIPTSMQEQFGYPPLTDKIKRRILGENAAGLYGVKPHADRCSIPLDALQQVQVAQGGARAGRSLRVFGAQTRREFFTRFSHELKRG